MRAGSILRLIYSRINQKSGAALKHSTLKPHKLPDLDTNRTAHAVAQGPLPLAFLLLGRQAIGPLLLIKIPVNRRW
jgi:hypothetical protein